MFDINTEIETKEENIKKLLDRDENPHLIRAKYERQITEMTEKISKLEGEKLSLLQNGVTNEKDKAGKKAKVDEKRRRRVNELEREIASLKKTKVEKERLAKDKREKEQFIEKMKSELETLKRKKVELVKKAQADQKKFNKIRLEKVTFRPEFEILGAAPRQRHRNFYELR